MKRSGLIDELVLPQGSTFHQWGPGVYSIARPGMSVLMLDVRDGWTAELESANPQPGRGLDRLTPALLAEIDRRVEAARAS